LDLLFDIYSLAVTLYEALVGHAPSSEMAPARMMMVKCSSAYDELSSLFARFYSRRGESGSALQISVGACHSVLQTLYIVSLLFLVVWLGIACIDFERTYAVTFAICLPIAFSATSSSNRLVAADPSSLSGLRCSAGSRRGWRGPRHRSVNVCRGSISGIPAA
jgi:hypothetical protein